MLRIILVRTSKVFEGRLHAVSFPFFSHIHGFGCTSEYMKTYKAWLELVIPRELIEVYNTEGPAGGCINPDAEGGKAGKDFKIKVIIDEKKDKYDTLERTCKRRGPEECDLDCQEYYPDFYDATAP